MVNHILTDKADPDYDKKFMQLSQVNAALGLMKKVLPDLNTITHQGDEDNPFLIKDISSKPLESKSTAWLENNEEVIEGETVQ